MSVGKGHEGDPAVAYGDHVCFDLRWRNYQMLKEACDDDAYRQISERHIYTAHSTLICSAY